MIDSPPSKASRSQITKTVMLVVALSVSLATASACGQADESAAFEPDGYEILGKSTQPTSTPTPIARPVEEQQVTERQVQVLSAVGEYSVQDFETLKNFKLSKNYNVEGLNGAESAIYGFFGPDPYDRQEYEARFYPDHETALTLGADFAIEATGPDAVIASALQRWDEGLSQRRTCAANVRGSHHSGRCDLAKYGDYVIAGNLVLLCQGRDSDSALDNCAALYSALQ